MEDNQIIINEDYGNMENTMQEGDDIMVTDMDMPTIDTSETLSPIADTDELVIHREEYNAHSIGSITNLREELDALDTAKNPQTVYSNQYGQADYYAWNDGAVHNTFGHFVSIVPQTNKIQICNGTNVFGVTVDKAGVAFVGGYDENGRNNTYALVATSGFVDVRCTTDVNVGDYVVPYVVQVDDNNLSVGMAKKSGSGYGYLVVAKDKWGADPYATIAFNVPADQIDNIGANIQSIDKRLQEAEARINSAMIIAADAVKKAEEVNAASDAASGKVDGVYDYVNDRIPFLEEGLKQAKVDTETVKNEAIKHADEQATNAIKYANDTFSTVSQLDDVKTTIGEQEQKLLGYSQQMADETFSFMASIDRYSVGKYSQSYGLTISQARDILEEGMIYVPTSHEENYTHEEEYGHTINNKAFTVKQNFTMGSYYKWKDGSRKVIAIDENGQEKEITLGYCWWEEYNEGVAFDLGVVPSSNTADYWYINGEVRDAAKDAGYESYTLYAYLPEKKDEETGYIIRPEGWTKVSTSASNMNNRMTSVIRQTANEIALEVTNAQKSVAAVEAEIDDTKSTVGTLSRWKNGEDTSDAIIRQVSDNDGASIVISTLHKTGETVNSEASLVLKANKNNASALSIGADYIDFEGSSFTVSAENIDFTSGDFRIGENLVLDYNTKQSIEGDSSYYVNYRISPTASDTKYTVTTSDDPYKDCKVGYLVPGQQYTIQIDFETDAEIGQFQLYYAGDKHQHLICDPISLPNHEGKPAVVRYTFTCNKGYTPDTANAARVSVFHYLEGGKKVTTKKTTTINRIQIEKGSIATGWSYAPEDAMSNNQSGTGMRWRMRPDKCVWWNNNTTESSPLMRLNNDGLYIKGQVEATSGHIGNWNVGTVPNGKFWGGGSDTTYSDSLYIVSESGKTTAPADITTATSDCYLTFLRLPAGDGSHVMGVRKKPYDTETKTFGVAETVFSIAKNGFLYAKNAEIAGKITATSLTLEPNATVSGLSYNSLSDKPNIPPEVEDLGDMLANVVYKDDIKQETKTDSNGVTYVETTVPSSSGNVKYSTYSTDNYIVFGRSKGTNSDGKNYFCISKEGLLTARNAVIYGTVYATDGEFAGKVTADEGEIGGWTIDESRIYKGNLGLATDNQPYTSLVSSGGVSPLRLYAGGEYPMAGYEKHNFVITSRTMTYSFDFSFPAGKTISNITKIELETRSGEGLLDHCSYSISGKKVTVTADIDAGADAQIPEDATFYVYYELGGTNFRLLEDGSLYAGAVDISGNIYASGLLKSESISCSGNASISNLTVDSLKINDSLTLSGGIRRIGSPAGSGIEIDAQSTNSQSYKVSVVEDRGNNENYPGRIKINIESGGKLLYNQSFNVRYKASSFDKDYKIARCDFDRDNDYQYFTISRHVYDVTFASGSSTFEFTQYDRSRGVFVDGDLCPKATKTYKLGDSAHLWKEIYCNTTEINTSDKNEKHSISLLPDKYGQLFDGLEPSIYKFNDGTSDRFHVGLIAQSVHARMNEIGMDTKEFAGICHWEKEDGELGYGLRYGEFIALNIDQIQKLKPRVSALEEKVQRLEAENSQLKEQITQLLNQG